MKTNTPLKRWGGRWTAAAASATAAAACLVGLGGGAAEATTQDTTGLPAPRVQISSNIGFAFEGRFFLSLTPRKSRIEAAQLDILDITEDEPTFYFGEITLRTANAAGVTENAVFDLWWFFYHKKKNRLTARLIPPGSVSTQHPTGVPAGLLSFAVPGARKTGFANNGTELRTLKGAQLTLDGKGPYKLTFKRGSDSGVVEKIPLAKQYGH